MTSAAGGRRADWEPPGDDPAAAAAAGVACIDLCNWCTLLAMPVLQRFPKCRVLMRTRDHRPAHVHVVMNDGREVLVYLDDLRIDARRRVARRDLSDAMDWIKARRSELIAQFEELQR